MVNLIWNTGMLVNSVRVDIQTLSVLDKILFYYIKFLVVYQ